MEHREVLGIAFKHHVERHLRGIDHRLEIPRSDEVGVVAQLRVGDRSALSFAGRLVGRSGQHRRGARQVDLRPLTVRPGRQRRAERIAEREPALTMDAMVVHVEHDAHAGAPVDFEHVAQAEHELIVLEREPRARTIRERLPRPYPAVNRSGRIVVGAADMDDDRPVGRLVKRVEQYGV